MSFVWTSCRQRWQLLLKSFLSQLENQLANFYDHNEATYSCFCCTVCCMGSTAWHIINFYRGLPPTFPPRPLASNIYGTKVTFYFVANTTICFLAQSLYSSIYFSSCR